MLQSFTKHLTTLSAHCTRRRQDARLTFRPTFLAVFVNLLFKMKYRETSSSGRTRTLAFGEVQTATTVLRTVVTRLTTLVNYKWATTGTLYQ